MAHIKDMLPKLSGSLLSRTGEVEVCTVMVKLNSPERTPKPVITAPTASRAGFRCRAVAEVRA